MLKCEVCNERYVVITQLHLRRHNLDIEKYLEKFPEAKIVQDFKCEICKKVVINGKSSRSKYCVEVECLLCNKFFKKGITNSKQNGHIWKKHNVKNEEYLKLFPDANLISCSEQVNKENVLYNVRQYNMRKKTFIQKSFKKANEEYGTNIDDDHTHGETRIDNTHSSWDFFPNSGFKVLGTVSDKDLTVNEDGRLRGLIKLQNQIKKMKETQK